MQVSKDLLITAASCLAVLVMLGLTVMVAIWDHEAQIISGAYSAPKWLVTLCVTAVSAAVYKVFKNQNKCKPNGKNGAGPE
jgi:hypothetical protein